MKKMKIHPQLPNPPWWLRHRKQVAVHFVDMATMVEIKPAQTPMPIDWDTKSYPCEVPAGPTGYNKPIGGWCEGYGSGQFFGQVASVPINTSLPPQTFGVIYMGTYTFDIFFLCQSKRGGGTGSGAPTVTVRSFIPGIGMSEVLRTVDTSNAAALTSKTGKTGPIGVKFQTSPNPKDSNYTVAIPSQVAGQNQVTVYSYEPQAPNPWFFWNGVNWQEKPDPLKITTPTQGLAVYRYRLRSLETYIRAKP